MRRVPVLLLIAAPLVAIMAWVMWAESEGWLAAPPKL